MRLSWSGLYPGTSVEVLASGEVYGPASLERLVSREDDSHGVEGIFQMLRGVEFATNGAGEEFLLSQAEAIVIGFIRSVDPLVSPGELIARVTLLMVKAEGIRLRVCVDVCAVAVALSSGAIHLSLIHI